MSSDDEEYRGVWGDSILLGPKRLKLERKKEREEEEMKKNEPYQLEVSAKIRDVLFFSNNTKEGRISGYPWELLVLREECCKDDIYRLAVELTCKKNKESQHWSCEADLIVTVVNHEDEEKSIVKNYTHRFDRLHPTKHMEPMLWDEFETPANGFIDFHGEIQVKCVIKVKRGKDGERFTRLHSVNFKENHRLSDVVIVAEYERFHVNKHILAHESPYFEKLFIDEKKTSVTVDGFKARDVTYLLGLIYNTGTEIDGENVTYLLDMAQKFQMKRVTDMCETYLLHTFVFEYAGVYYSTPHKLELAEKYGLHELYEECLRRLTFKELKEVRESTHFESFSVVLKNDLISRAIEIGMNSTEDKKKEEDTDKDGK